MERLTLPLDDYLLAIGGVGLCRIVQHGLTQQHLESEQGWLEYRHNEIHVHPDLLPHIPLLFFDYMLFRYSIYKRERDKLMPVSNGQKQRSAKSLHASLKTSMDAQMSKLVKYFSEDPTFLELQQVHEQVKIPYKEETDVHALIEQYLHLLATPRFDQKLTLNYIKASLMQPLHGQVSFLNVAMNSLTLDEQLAIYARDYIEPVQRDWSYQCMYAGQATLAEWKVAIENSDSAVHKAWKKTWSKWQNDQLSGFWNEQLRCTFIDEWFATANYEEMVFSPLAVSQVPNFYWNLNINQPVPLSSWAKLILFLSSAGLTTFRKNDMQYFSFIYHEGAAKQMVTSNQHLQMMEQGKGLNEVLSALLTREQHKATLEANIWYMEFSADYRAKKTLLDYYTIPRHIMLYFKDGNAKQLEKILDRQLREQFLGLVMQSIDPKHCIYRSLHEAIVGLMKGKQEYQYTILHAYYAIAERQRIKYYKKRVEQQKGELDMSTYVNTETELVNKMRNQGIMVRRGIISDQHIKQHNSSEYSSGPDKKLQAIAYRLLNFTKAGDKQQWLDTVLRLHLQAGKTVHPLMLNSLHEEEMDFSTVSGAFITGLLSYTGSLNEDTDNGDSETTK